MYLFGISLDFLNAIYFIKQIKLDPFVIVNDLSMHVIPKKNKVVFLDWIIRNDLILSHNRSK